MSDLRSHPQAIETAVEEFLRMESSNQLGNRRAAKDTVLGGVAWPAGSYVHICIGAANRDFSFLALREVPNFAEDFAGAAALKPIRELFPERSADKFCPKAVGLRPLFQG